MHWELRNSKFRPNGAYDHSLCLGPRTMKPPIITLSPVSTKLRYWCCQEMISLAA